MLDAQNLVLRKPTEAPTLQLRSPYARGLRFCTPFWEGFDHGPREIIDLVGLIPDLVWVLNGDVFWIDEPRGPGLRCNNSLSRRYADSVFTGNELTLTGNWTLLWAGTPTQFISAGDTMVSLSSDGIVEYASYHQASATIANFVLHPIGGGGFDRLVSLPGHELNKFQVMIAREDFASGLEVWRNGEHFGPAIANLATWIKEPGHLTISARQEAGLFEQPMGADHQMVAFWDHAIPDNWIPTLTADPFAMMRSDEDPEIFRYPIWKRLPCFDLGNRRVVLKPIDQTEVRDGQIQAASAARIRRERREIDLDLRFLSENEKTALLACWDDGAGLVRPFWMQLAGETEARRYVFKTPLFSIEHRGPSAKIAKASFIDVTRFEG